MTDQTEKLKALAASKIKTWQERMPKPRIAYQCDMNCSPRSEGKDCGDCMPVRVYGDPVAARDAEIADLRADNERLRAEKEAPDLHVIPPTRGTGSQQDADEAATNALYLDIMNIPCDESKANEEYSDRRIAYKHGHRDARHAAADLITELASRGCAQGGNTSENSGLLEDPKTAETRIGSSFEGGHLGSAPAAGTDKDAERYRWLRERRVEFSTGWYVGTFSKEDMDKAIDTAIGEHREPT